MPFEDGGMQVILFALRECMSIYFDIANMPEIAHERLILALTIIKSGIDTTGNIIIRQERMKYIEQGGCDIEGFREYLHQHYQDEDWMTPDDFHTFAQVLKRELNSDDNWPDQIQDSYEQKEKPWVQIAQEYFESDHFKDINFEMDNEGERWNAIIPTIIIFNIIELMFKKRTKNMNQRMNLKRLWKNMTRSSLKKNQL